MNTIYIILIILLILATIIGCSAAILYNQKIDKEKYSKKFKKAVNEVVLEMSSQFNEYLKNQEKDIQKALSEFQDTYEERRRNVAGQLKLLDENLNKAKERQEQQLKELEENTATLINNRSKAEAAQIQSIIEYYQNQQLQIANEFEDFKADVAAEKAILIEELNKEKQKQQEIINNYKREEEIKANRNFYRIVLSEEVQEDVKKLRKIAGELHDPTIIYKLIYKTYYEKPFTEMVGRVVSNDATACGIYKITNLENGRSYIGQTKQAFKERWRTHLKRGIKAEPSTQNKLYSAIWEDGAENFTFEVIATCSPEELNQKEREYIAFYHADTWGYNGTGGNIK